MLVKYDKLKIGTIKGATPQIAMNQGAISQVPYAEPSHLLGFHSPYYNKSHVQLRAAVRGMSLLSLSLNVL